MSLKDIIERFTLVSGMQMEEVSAYLPIIADCKSYFEAHLKAELSELDEARAMHACAVYAYYRISMLDGLKELSSFKVGDVQMELSKAHEAAEMLWQSERESVLDILDLDTSFAFGSVSV